MPNDNPEYAVSGELVGTAVTQVSNVLTGYYYEFYEKQSRLSCFVINKGLSGESFMAA